MPREIVFRLNVGGDATPVGAVDRPVFVDVVPVVVVPGVAVVPGVGVVPPVDVTEELGNTSGENTAPTAYCDSSRPYSFVRVRSTSRISTSMTISARGLSFCWMIRSMI